MVKIDANILLDKYLEENYPQLELFSPLFYNADIGIRFEIGNPDPSVTNEAYFEQVRHRSSRLFKETHHETDEILIVAYRNVYKNQFAPYKKRTFDHALKNSKVLRNLSCKTIILQDDDPDWETYRFVLPCKVSDIKFMKLLFSDYCMFFVNISKHTIFYFYDSRGLDIISYSTEHLKDLYINYNDWILNYDRDHNDRIFSP